MEKIGGYKSALHKLLPDGCAVAFLILLALIMTNMIMPLRQFSTHLFYGDIQIFAYILSWGSHALFTHLFTYYSPPIFYPNTFMLPGTDGLEVPALLLAPVWFLFHNPPLLANCALLLSNMMALIAAYFSLRIMLPISRIFAIVGSVLFAVCSDRFWHLSGHLNLIWSGILPIIFAGTWRCLERPSRKNTAIAGVSLGAAVYFSVYFFVLGGLVFATSILSWIFTALSWPRKKALFALGAALLMSSIIAAPKIIIYQHASARNTQARNSLSEASEYSASWAGYTQPTNPSYISWWYHVLPEIKERKVHDEDEQFIGYLLMTIVILEITRLITRLLRRNLDRWDRLSLISILLGILIVMASLGPAFHLWRFYPYISLYEVYLRFTHFYRVPARLAFVEEWFAALVAAILLMKVADSAPKLEKSAGGLVLIFIVFFEHSPSKSYTNFSVRRPGILDVLNQADPSGKQPYIEASQTMELGMALSTTDLWRPTVNGWYGSPLGAEYDKLKWAMQDFPSTRTLAWLAKNNVPWIISADPAVQNRARNNSLLKLIDSADGYDLYHSTQSQTLLTEFEKSMGNRASFLEESRRNAPAELQWPGNKLKFGGGYGYDGHTMPPVLCEIKDNHPVAFYLPESPLLPGDYDQIEVHYKVFPDDPNSQTKVYWDTPSQPMNEARSVGGTVKRSKDGYVGTYLVRNSFEWMNSENLKTLRLDFFQFTGTNPVKVEIDKVLLIQTQKTVRIPEI